ncbi:MAG: NADH-quinone oxidoreductase subunit NuoN [Magnetococcales bacterium]|nr:NADH-quinone oxidoreductase subunit NuoN [Magnetococcales bacterium]
MPVQLPDINLTLLLPEIFIALAGMALLLLTAWREDQEGRELVANGTIGTIVVAMGLLWFTAHTTRTTTFGGMFTSDSFALYMKMLMCTAALLPLLVSRDYLKRNEIFKGEYQVLSLFALLGGLIMASSGDFLTLYLGLELMSLSIYVLAAFRRDDKRSSEAGLKYFVLGSLASGILLYGITLIYGASGTTTFTDIHAYVSGDLHHHGAIVNLGMILILIGFSFKIAAAPFHMWAPDVYEGAPTSVTAFMAVMPKIAAFAALYRVLLEAFGPLHAEWSPVLQFLAVLSVAVGALAAIAQTNIKRMLAYSSIGHVGYVLIGLSVGSDLGYQAVLVYLAVYIFMNVGAFTLILLLNRDGVGDEISDYQGLAHKRPLLAFLMALFMFSMAGIPPLAGFIGKLYVFMAAVQAGMIKLAIVGILFSAVGAFYYLRVVKRMYFDQPQSDRDFEMEVSIPNRLVMGVTGLFVVIVGIFPEQILTWAKISMSSFQ